MLDRAVVIDKNFIDYVSSQHLPPSRVEVWPEQVGLDRFSFLQLFETQLLSRHLDLMARILKEKKQGFYTIGSSGHEGNAAVAKAFRHTDMAFLHYRSSAFMIQRSRCLPELDPVYDQLLSLMASSEDPIASGRHKVFGSVPLWVPPQTSTIASHLPKAVGAAVSITRAKELQLSSKLPADSVILCSFGDASLNHSTAQGALHSVQWIAKQNYPLPLVFICEDNGLGISVPTPIDWVEQTVKHRIGWHYIQADGLNLADVYRAACHAADVARHKKQAVFLHLRLVRLLGHAGSDIESQYCSQQIIEQREFNDPLLHSARIILENHYLTAKEIIGYYERARTEVASKMQVVATRPRLHSRQAIMASIIPPKATVLAPPIPATAIRTTALAAFCPQLMLKRNLAQMLNLALFDVLLRYPNALIFGEDVGKKGGVYRVTAGLMEHFGQRRVFDTMLDEQAILGHAIGLAHNGFLPIAEIQFLAYLHNAEDQLRGEAATLSFFSNGQYTNPLLIRIPSLAYQQGFGGHFHNDNSIAVLRDIPGIIIACPAHGLDAVKMLRTCVQLAYEEQRVIVFLEPIALYMTKDLYQAGDNAWLHSYPPPEEVIPFGEIGIYGPEPAPIVIITYANGYYLSRQAALELAEQHQVLVKIIDVRWLAPLPAAAIIEHVQTAAAILIVDEGRLTGSISEAIMALLLEQLTRLPPIKRLTGADSFIPLGDAWQYVLPSKAQVVEAVLALAKLITEEK